MQSAEELNVSTADRWVAWGLLAGAVVGNISGYTANLYSRWSAFDEVIHAYTIMAITVLLGLWAYGDVLTGFRRHAFLLIVTIGPFGLALGALWEVAEWLYDMTVRGT